MRAEVAKGLIVLGGIAGLLQRRRPLEAHAAEALTLARELREERRNIVDDDLRLWHGRMLTLARRYREDGAWRKLP